MKELCIVLSDEDEARLAQLQLGGDPRPLIESLVTSALKEAVRDRVLRVGAYRCPVCAVDDPNAYLRCNRPDCTDGRDPR